MEAGKVSRMADYARSIAKNEILTKMNFGKQREKMLYQLFIIRIISLRGALFCRDL